MQMTRQFIYCFQFFFPFLFFESVFVSLCSRKTPQQPHCFVASSPLSAQLSLHAAAASCCFSVGTGSVYHWGWSAHMLHVSFSSWAWVFQVHREIMCPFNVVGFHLLLLPCCSLILGEQTGRPVSETRQAYG